MSELEGVIHEAKEVGGDRSFRMRPQTGFPATKIEMLHPKASPEGMGQARVWSDFSRRASLPQDLGEQRK